MQYIQKQYPAYFKEKIRFNFFQETLSTIPRISPLSNDGLDPCKKDKFQNISNDYYESFINAPNKDKIEEGDPYISPLIRRLFYDIDCNSENVFNNYNALLYNKHKIGIYPSGTCIPFSKKMFLTAKGKILQCERINHKYNVGMINDDQVHLDIKKIATYFNKKIYRFSFQCKTCIHAFSCTQCIFRTTSINDGKECIYYHKLDETRNSIDLHLLRANPEVIKTFYNSKTID